MFVKLRFKIFFYRSSTFENYALVSNYAVDYGDDGNHSIGTGGQLCPWLP